MRRREFMRGRLWKEDSRRSNWRISAGVEAGRGIVIVSTSVADAGLLEFPTVSMGLGPLMSIYQARFNRYLENRGLKTPTDAKVWAFLGDGETDEPESLGAITLASRENLDNLILLLIAICSGWMVRYAVMDRLFRNWSRHFAGRGGTSLKFCGAASVPGTYAPDEHHQLLYSPSTSSPSRLTKQAFGVRAPESDPYSLPHKT